MPTAFFSAPVMEAFPNNHSVECLPYVILSKSLCPVELRFTPGGGQLSDDVAVREEENDAVVYIDTVRWVLLYMLPPAIAVVGD